MKTFYLAKVGQLTDKFIQDLLKDSTIKYNKMTKLEIIRQVKDRLTELESMQIEELNTGEHVSMIGADIGVVVL